MKYCPLNILTGYTFLSSALKVEDIFKICKKKGYSYFGICDINVMFGYSDIVKYADAASAKPIYGATVSYRLSEEDPVQLSLFIRTEEGYRNLCKILSHFPEGIGEAELKELKRGLIAVLPTVSNDRVKEILLRRNFPEFSARISALSEGFDGFYFGTEIYQKSDRSAAEALRAFAAEHAYRCVAFNRHLYAEKRNAITLNILDAIKKDARLDVKTAEGPYFFLTEEAISKLYTEAEIEATNSIALACSAFDFRIKRGKLLSFPLQRDKKEYLKELCLARLETEGKNTPAYCDRLNYELDIIGKMGFLDYFLLVRDYVAFARKNAIPVGPGRGSAAGSLVSYLLGITEIDPLEYDLLFERFLNPKRSTMPDIDIDFADYQRDRISAYIMDTYGRERTANIITFQTFGARAALRDIGKVFNIHPKDISLITQLVGRSHSFASAYKSSAAFRDLCKDAYYLDIIRLARSLEGLPRQAGMHAAGILINDEELSLSCPVIRGSEGSLLTQFEGPLLNELGYLKMDLLGLTNLTILESMEQYIRKYYRKDFSITSVPLNDARTFDILNRGLTCGIFQLESSGITRAMKEVRIDTFNDIVAVLALYRPGPMENIPLYAETKNRKLPVKYLHPSLEPILSSTYGVIVYQEQIMQIVQVIAGFDLGRADIFRRAISKKDAEALSALKSDFIAGALSRGIAEDTANRIFELILKFADYGFNKSHSVSYAVITYHMAYIKANFPQAFYAGTLNYLSLSDPRISAMRQELSYFHLKFRLPDILKSDSVFVIEGDDLILPFSLIKGLNRQALLTIREIQKQPVPDFPSFMRAAHEKDLNDASIIAMINAGCFDRFAMTRTTLRHAVPIYRNYYQTISAEGSLTQEELKAFMPIVEEEAENERLKYDLEYQALGILLSGSLLTPYRRTIARLGIRTIREHLAKEPYSCQLAAIVEHIRKIYTKKKEQMAVLNVRDDSGEIEVVVFPKQYQEAMLILKEGDAYIIRGSLRKNGDARSVVADKIIKLEENDI